MYAPGRLYFMNFLLRVSIVRESIGMINQINWIGFIIPRKQTTDKNLMLIVIQFSFSKLISVKKIRLKLFNEGWKSAKNKICFVPTNCHFSNLFLWLKCELSFCLISECLDSGALRSGSFSSKSNGQWTNNRRNILHEKLSLEPTFEETYFCSKWIIEQLSGRKIKDLTLVESAVSRYQA